MRPVWMEEWTVDGALIRALLRCELAELEDSYGMGYAQGCGACSLPTLPGVDGSYEIKHEPGCSLDVALTLAGLPDQASRDEARRLIAERKG
jgi:hypothetical protein